MKKITMAEYNNKMADIIKMGKPVSDTLIQMLEEAGKFTIKRSSRSGKLSQKHTTICDKKRRKRGRR